MSQSTNEINQDIECLRAIAIIMVMVQHIKNMFNPPQAWMMLYKHVSFWTGVDLFLVISGYVISKSLLNSGDTVGKFKLKTIVIFYIKRVFRILPNALLWLLIPLVFYSTFIKSVANINIKLMTNAVVASIFYYSNIFWAYCVTNNLVGKVAPNPDSIGIYWSLSLEEQFYIIFPLLLLFIRKRYLIILFYISIILQMLFPRPSFSYRWALRTDAIMMGIIISFYFDKVELPNIVIKYQKAFEALIPIITLLLILVIPILTSYYSKTTHGYGLTIIALLCSVLVFIATLDTRMMFPPFVKPILSFIGSRSYSLYLCHLFVFAIIRESYVRLFGGIPMPNWSNFLPLAFIGIAVAMFVANINYLLIEVPLRNVGRKYVNNSQRYKETISSVTGNMPLS